MSEIKVLLLRGVNVGGANRLGMPEFRDMLGELGLGSVQTHIQTGNVVFLDPENGDVTQKIAAAMRPRFGFAPAMFLYSLADYLKILAANPYKTQGKADGAAVHIYFLDAPATGLDLAALRALSVPGESITQTDAAIYLLAPDGVGRSSLAARLGLTIGVTTTARNQRSCEAIAAMAQSITT